MGIIVGFAVLVVHRLCLHTIKAALALAVHTAMQTLLFLPLLSEEVSNLDLRAFDGIRAMHDVAGHIQRVIRTNGPWRCF